MQVLLIDDDVELTTSLKLFLAKHKMTVCVAHDTRAAQSLLQCESFDAVLLDVMLPDEHGFDFLPTLRNLTQAHVIMLTALGDEDDRITGLNLGADDYVTKPFSAKELIARLRAVRRRQNTPAEPESQLKHDDLELFPGRHMVMVGDLAVALTGAECRILQQLMNAPKNTLSRELLHQRVLGRELSPTDRSLDTHVSNLRKKLGPHAAKGSRIRSIRGLGYVLTA